MEHCDCRGELHSPKTITAVLGRKIFCPYLIEFRYLSQSRAELCGTLYGFAVQGKERSDFKDFLQMNRYESYKNSGVEWIGEVPSHWEVKKMKYLFRDISIKNKPNEILLSVTQDRGVIPRNWIDGRVVMPSGNLGTFKFIEKGDFAISLRSFEGGLEFCHHNGIISPAYTVLKYNKNHLIDLYYKFLFKSQKFISELQISIIGIREGKNISYEELQYSYLPIPPLAEQTAIAQYLDDKTAKIDQAIMLEEKQIELLKEHKQILIQNTVTKGLNPQVKFKHSGVEWLGEVPEHWEVKKLKYLGRFLNGFAFPSYAFKDYGIRVIKISNIQPMKISWEEKSFVDKKSYGYLENFYVKKGDVVFALTRPIINGGIKVAIFNEDEPVLLNQRNAVFKGNIKLLPKWQYYVMQHSGYINKFNSQIDITGQQPNISIFDIRNIFLPLPRLEEQHQIANYLDQQTAKIDHAIQLKQQQIDKFREYKTVLINDVVTGRMKVA